MATTLRDPSATGPPGSIDEDASLTRRRGGGQRSNEHRPSGVPVPTAP